LLAERGYDPVLGARPLRRTIQREIEDELSERILFGELRPGQIVVVDVEGEGAEAKLTFAGNDRSPFPDMPPIELTTEA
jgi:ATP-dependent Clp protease ATP-binding subunit ClpC